MALEETELIWKNGEFIPWADATTHILTHSLQYGSAVFEGIRCYAGEGDAPSHVFRLQDHMDRLIRSCKIALIPCEYTADDLVDATLELIKRNGLKECYIRPFIYRGYGSIGVDPTECPTEVAIAVWPWGAYLGEEALENGIAVGVSSWRQRSVNAIPPAMKASASYMNAILAKLEAKQNGYAEAIMLNENGYVAEGTGENIFIVRDGILSTPPISDGVLEGITRDTVLWLANDLDIPIVEESMTRADLYTADEIFLTGSAAELTPVNSVDGRDIGKAGPVTKQLQEAFFDVVKGKREEYMHWLAEVPVD